MKSKILICIGLQAIFLLGMVAGGVIVAHIFRTTVDNVAEGKVTAVNELVVKRLSKKLELSGDQKAEFAGIVHQAQDEIFPIRVQAQLESYAVIRSHVPETRRLLNERQNQKLDALLAQLEENEQKLTASLQRRQGAVKD